MSDSPSELTAASEQVHALRTSRYLPEGMTYAATTPLALAEAVKRLGDAFSIIPASAVTPAGSEALGAAFSSARSSGGSSIPSAPFPDLGRAAGGAMALQRPGKRAVITLAWECENEDSTAETRQKPLDLIGHALTEPHARSLASVLRARGLSPLQIELEPIVSARVVARADSWVIWQLEITLCDGVESRWREAAAIAIAAVDKLAQRGVPVGMVSEVQRMSEAAWKYSSRPPTAVELATDLQLEPTAELSVLGSRTYVGDPASLSAAANAAAKQLAARSPIITVYAEDLAPLGVNENSVSPALPAPLSPLARLTPLRFSISSAAAATQASAALRPIDLQPPPSNPWVPSTFEPVASPMASVGFRLVRGGLVGDDGVGGDGADGGAAARPQLGSGLGTLQLPGCIERRTLSAIPGSTAALADALCRGRRGAEYGPARLRPTAVAVLQLESSVPASASVRQAARGELWRLTLLQALSEQSAASNRGGLKCDVSFNTRGMRLIVSGFSQRLPKLMALLLRRTLRHLPPNSGTPELAAARRAALLAASKSERGGQAPPGRVAELQRCTPDDLQAEVTRLFRSVRGASLLLAGDLSVEAAEALTSVVRRELEPLLPAANYVPDAALGLAAQPLISIEDELAQWSGLLYKPSFSLALSECYDPALARALDQCGGI